MTHHVPATAPASPTADPAAAYKIERYKYILQQLNAINDNLHKYLTLFQTLATAIIGAGAAVFVSWKKLEIPAPVAAATVQWLLVVLALLGAFVVMSIVMGIFSWLDYRREEVALLDKEVGVGYRDKPQVKNIWRWYEFWAIVFVLVFSAATIVLAEQWVVPKIV